jgi:hypothetical protein
MLTAMVTYRHVGAGRRVLAHCARPCHAPSPARPAEAVMRLAAWICTPSPAQRAERVEAWRRILKDAARKERPAHATSFLWMAVRPLPSVGTSGDCRPLSLEVHGGSAQPRPHPHDAPGGLGRNWTRMRL